MAYPMLHGMSPVINHTQNLGEGTAPMDLSFFRHGTGHTWLCLKYVDLASSAYSVQQLT